MECEFWLGGQLRRSRGLRVCREWNFDHGSSDNIAYGNTPGHMDTEIFYPGADWPSNFIHLKDVGTAPPQRIVVSATADGNPGETQFMVATSNGSLYYNIRFSTGAWQGFAQLGGARTGHSGQRDCRRNPGETQFMVATSNGSLYHNIRFSTGAWQGFAQLRAPGQVIAVSATADGNPGETQFMVAMSNGSLYHNIRFSTGAWQGFRQLGAPGQVIAVSATADGNPGETQFMVATSNGSLYHNIRFSTGAWQGFAQLGAPGQVTAVAAADDWGVPMLGGEAEFMVATSSGALYHNIRYRSGSWQGFNQVTSAPGQITDVSAAGDDYPQEAQFVVATSSGDVYHSIRFSNGSWSAFSRVFGS